MWKQKRGTTNMPCRAAILLLFLGGSLFRLSLGGGDLHRHGLGLVLNGLGHVDDGVLIQVIADRHLLHGLVLEHLADGQGDALASVLTSSTFTRTMSPTLTASSTLAMRVRAHWEMCTRPSRPGSSSTKAPKVVMRTTLPSTMEPTGYFSPATVHGRGRVCL